MSEPDPPGGALPDVDLSDQPLLAEPSAPPVTAYNLQKAREDVRGYLACGLAVLLGLVVVGAGTTVALAPGRIDAMVELLQLVFTPIVGLVGSAVGFYFGASSVEKSEAASEEGS